MLGLDAVCGPHGAPVIVVCTKAQLRLLFTETVVGAEPKSSHHAGFMQSIYLPLVRKYLDFGTQERYANDGGRASCNGEGTYRNVIPLVGPFAVIAAVGHSCWRCFPLLNSLLTGLSCDNELIKRQK